MAEVDANTGLEQYFAQEMALFFEHLQTATVQYAESGELPKSLFGVKAKNRVLKPKRKDSGVKRPLSAYNIFVKEKYEEIKRSHPEGKAPPFKEIFSQVAEMWKGLGETERAEYVAKSGAAAAAGVPVAEAAETESDETEEDDEPPPPQEEHKKKKKKDKHHKPPTSSDDSD